LTRVLVAGVPRSGTTWVAEMLGLAHGAVVVQEPDNPDANPAAAPVRRERGMHPVLEPGIAAPDYARIWDLAFAGGWPTGASAMSISRGLRKLPPPVLNPVLTALSPLTARLRRQSDHHVVKSVFVTFSVEWVVARYRPRVVLVDRNPLDVISSWLEVGIPIGDLDSRAGVGEMAEDLGVPQPEPQAPLHQRVAWCVGLLTVALRRTAARHPDWIGVSHGELGRAPEREFEALYDELGMPWSDAVRAGLDASDNPGSGYQTRRVRAELVDVWRQRLSHDQERDIRAVIEGFDALDPSRGVPR
jgi:hypothetical protein